MSDLQYYGVSAEAIKKIELYCTINNLSIRMANSLIMAYTRMLNYTNAEGKTEYKIRQRVIAKLLGFSREWTCTLLGHLEKAKVLIKELPNETERKNSVYNNFYKYFLPLQKKLKNLREKFIKEKQEKSKNNKKDDTNNKGNYNSYSSTSKKSTFNNFEQRDYDFQDLEKKLLGWQDDFDESS